MGLTYLIKPVIILLFNYC